MSITTKHAKDTKRELPPGWKWVRLGEVCELNYGSSLVEATRQQGNIPVYGSNGIVGYHNKPITSGPTVVIGRKGSVGQIHFSPVACYPIDTTYYIQHTNLPVDLEWLSNILKVLDLSHLNKASGVPGLNRNDVTKLFIPLPALPEQQRIVAILREQMAAVEKARKAAEERLEAVKSLPAAFLRQVFPQPGQPLPPGWKWVRLGEVTTVVNGTTPASENPAYWGGHIVWITPTDLGRLTCPEIISSERRITANGFRSCNLTLVPPGTVVMSSRAPIGHLGIATIEVCTNQGCKSFVPGPNVDSFFLYYALKCSIWKLQQIGSGATFDEVSKTQCEGFPIPLPPLAEQQRIAAVLREQMAAVERARKAAEEELETINALPAALLRRAFAGEL